MSRKKVVGYLRVSTLMQAEKGTSIKYQLEDIQQYCAKNDFELVEYFEDKGKSGSEDLTTRTGLGEMIKFCRSNDIDYVIVFKFDRLARDNYVQLWIEKELAVVNTGIISISEENLCNDDPISIAMRSILVTFAQLEKNIIVSRLVRGMVNKASNGNKPNGRQPFGYQYDNDKNTVCNDEEAEIVRTMFELKKQGLGTTEIACRLNKMDYNLRNNIKWTKQSVRLRLMNDYYLGLVTFQKKKIWGNHPAIIDLDTWKCVNGEVPNVS